MLFIFDMGGVVTNTANYIEDICKNLNITKEKFNQYINKNQNKEDDLFTLLTNGKINTKEFWLQFEEKSNIKISTDYFYLMFHPKMNMDVKEIIEKLKKKNRVVCGTNTIESHYFNHMQRGDYSIFDQTYASNFMGCSKPNESFWNLILKAEDEKPENAFFTDDKEENCKAAAKLGIITHQFKNAENLYKAVEKWF